VYSAVIQSYMSSFDTSACITWNSFKMGQMHRIMLMCQRHFVGLKGSVHVVGLKIFWLIKVVPGTNAALWGHTKTWGHKTVYLMFLRLLVVSTETYRGGLKVNEVRHQINLSTLDIHTVDLLEAVPEYTDEEEEEEKESVALFQPVGFMQGASLLLLESSCTEACIHWYRVFLQHGCTYLLTYSTHHFMNSTTLQLHVWLEIQWNCFHLASVLFKFELQEVVSAVVYVYLHD